MMSIPLKPDDPAYWMLQEGRRRTVTAEQMRRAAVESTVASAKLEGREVPADHIRSAEAEKFLDAWVSTPMIHRIGCYICEDEEFALMGLPLCTICKHCTVGHVPADDNVCDDCGAEQ